MHNLTNQQKFRIVSEAAEEADEWDSEQSDDPSDEECAAYYFDLIMAKVAALQRPN